MKRYFLALAACAAVVSACRQSGKEQSAINPDSLVNRIKILASDEFQGRRPFTAGEKKTIEYVSKSFASLGLEPANGTSFLQQVPMVEITPACDPVMKLESAKGKLELRHMDDYVIWTESTEPVVALTKDDVVFAGFGIVAPEYNWNDYAGLDVKGKVVLVMVNDPGLGSGDSTFFKGDAMTYYGRWTYKFEEASRQGAKGCFIIHNTRAASYAFDVVQNSWGGAQLHLDPRGNKSYRVPVEGWLSAPAAKKLLTFATGDTTLLAQAHQKGFKAMPLGMKATTSMKVQSVFNTSSNVIAKLTGATHPDEYVVYTAHWDHFGIGKPDEKGDSIYNGAEDNASGTAALLEIARAFKNLKEPPQRSILFLAVTGEEQGLLGSAYYAQNPIYPMNKTVANINVDGFNYLGKVRDILVIGAGQSELEDYLAEAAKEQGRYISNDTHPEAGLYFRSDHFNFAKAGVPALMTGSGVDDVAQGKVYGQKIRDEANDLHYHRPSDQYDPSRWNLAGGVQDIELLFEVGKRVANQAEWPRWKEHSEFKALRN